MPGCEAGRDKAPMKNGGFLAIYGSLLGNSEYAVELTMACW
jgi:hypothetical protein